MGSPNSTDNNEPATHIVDFFYDDDDACALTARINDVRFHIIANPAKLKVKADPRYKVYEEYVRKITSLRDRDESQFATPEPASDGEAVETSKSDGGDSGVEVIDRSTKRSPSQDSGINPTDTPHSTGADRRHEGAVDKDPEISLQNWILSCFSDVVDRLAPNANRSKARRQSLHQWYNTPVAFFELTVQNHKLAPEEIEETPILRKRLNDLLPSLPMPKYIRSLPDLPTVKPEDVTVLTTATHDPSTPIHPVLVSIHLPDSPSAQDFFFKPVDTTQPSPTKREIALLHKIQRLRLDHQINVPRLHALVSAPPLNGASTTSIMGLLLTPIPTPVTPLTVHLTPSSLSASERQFYATEVQRTIQLLHAHDIVFGDAKADNFLVDKDGKLWIIDFGGSYTEGWVEPELEETREGDLQGIEKIVEGLVEDDEEDDGDGGRQGEDGDGGRQGEDGDGGRQGEEGDGTDIEEDTKRARGKRKRGNVDDSTKEGDEKTEKKVKR